MSERGREGAGESASASSLRPESLTSWHDDWTGLRVAVYGLGMTGFSVADTLAELGARVLVLAGSHDEERERILEVLDVPVVVRSPLDSVPEELVAFDPELVIASPGFAPHHPLMQWADARGLAVWGDIELAWRLRDKVGEPAAWLCVTGTNGKTTTTQLAAHMVLESGMRVAPCGNIGLPILDAIRDPRGYDVLVVELSSYQLHSMTSVAPHASVVLNIADDHLDWHGSADAYRLAKGRVYERTRVACIYNLADDTTMRLVEEADVQEGCRAIGFGLGSPGPSDFGIVDGILVDRAFLDDRGTRALELTTIEQLREIGLGAGHLVQDVLAAAALARSVDVPPAAIRDAVRSFTVDRHRNEVVGERSGVTWVDDSKATNGHAANASLHAYDSVVWVVGGLLKGVDLTPLIAKHALRLRAAVIIGVDQDAIIAAFEQHAPNVPVSAITVTDTGDVMPRVVATAAEVAEPGDTVLLAPAAASMDQFVSYSDRGEKFAAAVRGAWEADGDDGKGSRDGSEGQGGE